MRHLCVGECAGPRQAPAQGHAGRGARGWAAGVVPALACSQPPSMPCHALSSLPCRLGRGLRFAAHAAAVLGAAGAGLLPACPPVRLPEALPARLPCCATAGVLQFAPPHMPRPTCSTAFLVPAPTDAHACAAAPHTRARRAERGGGGGHGRCTAGPPLAAGARRALLLLLLPGCLLPVALALERAPRRQHTAVPPAARTRRQRGVQAPRAPSRCPPPPQQVNIVAVQGRGLHLSICTLRFVLALSHAAPRLRVELVDSWDSGWLGGPCGWMGG